VRTNPFCFSAVSNIWDDRKTEGAGFFLYMHTCVYINMCVYTHTYMYIYVCLKVCVDSAVVSVSVSVFVSASASASVSMFCGCCVRVCVYGYPPCCPTSQHTCPWSFRSLLCVRLSAFCISCGFPVGEEELQVDLKVYYRMHVVCARTSRISFFYAQEHLLVMFVSTEARDQFRDHLMKNINT